jgi:hypothetical protein
MTHHTLDDAIAKAGGCGAGFTTLELRGPQVVGFDPTPYLADATKAPAVTAIDPSHYRSHPSGIECITITQHMGFNLGNAVKYIWRCDLKLDAIEDLKKAKWYIEREIAKREAQTV